jgi:rubrerythrin
MSALPVEIGGMTRSAFILRGALGTAGLYGAGAVAPFVARALGQTSNPDVEGANFALALENLEAAFYAAALKSANLRGEVKKLATEFGKHETTHVDTLKQLVQGLGGKPGAPAAAKFKLSSQADFLKAAVALEDIGVGAYNGVIPTFTTPDIKQAAASIVQVEARHAAALRFRSDQDPAPNAFDPALTPAQAQKAAGKVSGG